MKFSLKEYFGMVFCLLLCILSFGGCMTVRGIEYAGQEAAGDVLTQDALEQAIIDSCVYDRSVDISEYELTSTELEALFYSLQAEGRLPWYVSGACCYSYASDSGLVVEFKPDMLYGGDVNKDLYEQKAAEILDECVSEGMSQHQIALSLHDYLVANFEYDKTLSKGSSYDLLIHGTATCAGYSLAYQDLLNRVGIQCLYVTSKNMAHSWNLVKIDGQWYHVDVTWDDPTPNVYGYVSHDYFLVTDEGISSGKEPHYGWNTTIASDDTRFANAYWRNVHSQISFVNAEHCYFLRCQNFDNHIIMRNEFSGEETVLYSLQGAGVFFGSESYLFSHYGLSCWGDRLYCGSPSKVLSMNTDGADVREEYVYDTNENQKYILGVFVAKDKAYLSVADLTGNVSDFELDLCASDYHVHSYSKTVALTTCQEPGFDVLTCSCGISYRTNIVEPAEHSYHLTKDGVLSAFGSGVLVQTCSVCGDTEELPLSKVLTKEWLSENVPVVVAVWAMGLVFLLVCLRKKR